MAVRLGLHTIHPSRRRYSNQVRVLELSLPYPGDYTDGQRMLCKNVKRTRCQGLPQKSELMQGPLWCPMAKKQKTTKIKHINKFYRATI